MNSPFIMDYLIKDKDGNLVGFHRQHTLGKTHWGDLLDFTPTVNYTIKATGYDDQGEFWECAPQRLDKFLTNLVKTKATFETVDDWLKGFKNES